MCARQAVSRCTEADLAQLEARHLQIEELAAGGDLNAYYETNFRIHEARGMGQTLQSQSPGQGLSRQNARGDREGISRLACKTPGEMDHKLQVGGVRGKALVYLGRYLYRGVIQEKDIVACEDGNVTYSLCLPTC